jgi:hypothetical protein
MQKTTKPAIIEIQNVFSSASVRFKDGKYHIACNLIQLPTAPFSFQYKSPNPHQKLCESIQLTSISDQLDHDKYNCAQFLAVVSQPLLSIDDIALTAYTLRTGTKAQFQRYLDGQIANDTYKSVNTLTIAGYTSGIAHQLSAKKCVLITSDSTAQQYTVVAFKSQKTSHCTKWSLELVSTT